MFSLLIYAAWPLIYDMNQLFLYRAPHIVQVQLGECMKNIVLVDFPEKWPSLMPQLTQNLQSQVCLCTASVHHGLCAANVCGNAYTLLT